MTHVSGTKSGLGKGKSGGDDGIRTHDLCSAIAALSQLSYIPTRTTEYILILVRTWDARFPGDEQEPLN